MKKTTLTIIISTLLTITITHANNAEPKPEINYMAEIMKMDQQEKMLDKEIKAEKKETESLVKVGKKLDELENTLAKKKLQNKR